MADIDIDPFGEHESRPDEPMDESIPLTQVGGGSTLQRMGCARCCSHYDDFRYRHKCLVD